jgi:hypothetical protein
MLAHWGYRNGSLVHDTLWNVREATWNVSETSKVVNQNSKASFEAEKKILGETSEFIKLTNIQLYGKSGHPGLIPQVSLLAQKAQPVMDNLALATSRLDDAMLHLDQLIQSGNASVKELQNNEKAIEALIADLDAQVNDPAIKEILAQFLKVAQNAAEATGQFAATTTDLRQVADKMRETYLKPVNIWWALVRELLPLAGSAAQVIK